MIARPNEIINLFKYQLDLIQKGDKLSASPISLQLEPTSFCNLNCEMCEHSFNKFGDELSLPQFIGIIDKFPYLKNLTLQGLGEPLLCKDLFLMISEAKKRKIRVGFTTNATLLNNESAKKIINSGLDWMYISLDALDKSLYERIRQGAKFEAVINNIKNFIKIKGNQLPHTNFWTLIMKDNIKEIPKIVAFADDLKIKKIVLQNIHNWGFESFNSIVDTIKNNSENEFSELINEINNIPHTVRIEIYRENKKGKQKCNWPWRSLYITASGFVTPCCMQGSDPKVINFGNVWQDDIVSILKNDRYKNFRHELKNGCPKACINCPAFFEQKKITL